MQKQLRIAAVLIVAAAGAAVAISKLRVTGLDSLDVGWGDAAQSDSPPPSGDTIRVASFNIQVFGQSKLRKRPVMEVLAKVVRRFDVVAIQEIRSKQQDVLPRFLELVNAGGRKYAYVVSPRLGRSVSKEQYAFIFDSQRIEVAVRTAVPLADPGDRLHREPMMAAFRVRGPPAEEAFTFTLVNVHTDPDVVHEELNALDEAYRAVRNDGRGEDDVIMLGDFNTHDGYLGQLADIPYLTAAICGTPTNTRRSRQYDNILFDRQATKEFTGKCGVLDLMSEFGLTVQQALQVSDHFPVWAEFSVYEGGAASYVARKKGAKAK